MDRIPKCNAKDTQHLIRVFTSEMLGTFLLCYVIAITCALPLEYPINAIINGCAFSTIIWIFGPISGAQINPAVSLAMFLTRRISIIYLLICCCAQFVGAFFGILFGRLSFAEVMTHSAVTSPRAGVSIMQTMFLEIIGTFCLILVILSAADEFKPLIWTSGIFGTFPFVMGLTLTFISAVFGFLSGGSFNPARSVAPAIIDGNYEHLWIYMISPIIGSILTVLLYEMILTNAASTARWKDWWKSEFDRTKNYTESNISGL